MVHHVDQAIAALALVADPARDARQPRDQRVLQGVRQHVGGAVVAALEDARVLQALAQLQRAVAESAGAQDRKQEDPA